MRSEARAGRSAAGVPERTDLETCRLWGGPNPGRLVGVAKSATPPIFAGAVPPTCTFSPASSRPLDDVTVGSERDMVANIGVA